MINFLKRIFRVKKKETIKYDFEWETFRKSAKDQFRRLNKRGIHLPVFTL